MKLRFVALFIVIVSIVASSISSNADSKATPERPPHAAALDLVFREGLDTIRSANKEDWWHDTKSHDWEVKRPFAPGVYDSTHWFHVTYKIDGETIATWFVDTRNQKVELRKPQKSDTRKSDTQKSRLSEDILNHSRIGNASESLPQSVTRIENVFVMQSQLVQNRGMPVLDGNSPLDSCHSEFVCFAKHRPTSNSATGHPSNHGVFVVVATRIGNALVAGQLSDRKSSKLSTPNYQRAVQ
jgi:hypothetical protein